MRLSEQWLRQWVNPPVSSDELAERLTMAGLAVDTVTPVAGAFSGVVVGQIIEVKQHPNADRLRLCTLDIGVDTVDVVCGGTNVRPQLKVPLAKIGASLPGGLSIKRSKIRGEVSSGMICSIRELGLGDNEEGFIWELPNEAPVGLDFRQYLQLEDQSFDLDITPNRGDCLSIRGIAREVAALFHLPSQEPELSAVEVSSTQQRKVTLLAKAECPYYVGRVMEGIDQAVGTPLWLSERLRRSGYRSIHPVVDVTNYVMLELGQPLHAFDLEKIQGNIEIKLGIAGDTLTLLDGQQITLQEQTLMIYDEKSPLAIAGIMGGLASGVSLQTSSIFLESAFFTPTAIAGRARVYGIHSEASQRFERGIDPQLQLRALERATELLLGITGGEAGPIVQAIAPEFLPTSQAITLRQSRLTKLLGISLDSLKIKEILVSLGMKITAEHAAEWTVLPPNYRWDIRREIDLIEEVARLYGYNNIPAQLPRQTLVAAAPTETQLQEHRIRALMNDRGYHEAITYSFIDPIWQQAFYPNEPSKVLANPLSSELSVMRTSLWPGLLSAIHYNQSRQQPRSRFFEIGMVFQQSSGQLVQSTQIAGVICGTQYPEQWGLENRMVDFFDLKSDVCALLTLGHPLSALHFQPSNAATLHPARQAALSLQGQIIGHLGELHPALGQKFKFSSPILLFEVNFSAVLDALVPEFAILSKFPAIRRDLAIVVDKTLSILAVRETLESLGGASLKQLIVFDVYEGAGVPAGKKSVALGLILQEATRTLLDEEVATLLKNMLAALQQRFGAYLRD